MSRPIWLSGTRYGAGKLTGDSRDNARDQAGYMLDSVEERFLSLRANT